MSEDLGAHEWRVTHGGRTIPWLWTFEGARRHLARLREQSGDQGGHVSHYAEGATQNDADTVAGLARVLGA